MGLAAGLRAEVRRTVTEEATAERLGSGDVPVLGTPAVLALCEEAAVKALAGALEAGTTTVGTWVELEHLAPSPVGAAVRAEAELTRVDGRRLEFTCRAYEGERLIASARHRRAVVGRDRFLAAARAADRSR